MSSSRFDHPVAENRHSSRKKRARWQGKKSVGCGSVWVKLPIQGRIKRSYDLIERLNMKKPKKHSTRSTPKAQLATVQAELEISLPANSADENNARLDRIFDRLYKLRGSDLKGLSDEIESEDPAPRRECNAAYLFHVAATQMAAENALKDTD
jgi:hypothetical protein